MVVAAGQGACDPRQHDIICPGAARGLDSRGWGIAEVDTTWNTDTADHRKGNTYSRTKPLCRIRELSRMRLSAAISTHNCTCEHCRRPPPSADPRVSCSSQLGWCMRRQTADAAAVTLPAAVGPSAARRRLRARARVRCRSTGPTAAEGRPGGEGAAALPMRALHSVSSGQLFPSPDTDNGVFHGDCSC